MNNYKNMRISIICPIYNSAKYLNECLESLLNQSCNDFQLILVDDCSTDNSYEIALSYLEKFKNLQLFKNEQNMGVSYTRNKGIDNAVGDYLIFLDSDDLVECDLVEKIISKIDNINEPWSMLYYSIYKIKDKKDIGIKITKYNNNLNKNLLIKYILDERKLGGYIYNKVFKLDIIKENKIRFDEDIFIAEDEVFCLKYLKYVNESAFSIDCKYYYRENPDSITANIDKRKITNLAKARCRVFELLIDDKNSLLAYYYFLISLIYLSIVSNSRLIDRGTIFKSIKLFFNRYIKFKDKICVLLYFFNFKLVKTVYDKRH